MVIFYSTKRAVFVIFAGSDSNLIHSLNGGLSKMISWASAEPDLNTQAIWWSELWTRPKGKKD